MRLITQALEFGHNLGIRRWVGRLFPYADRWWFPPLTAALSAAATLSLTVPVGPMLTALVALNPRRWRAIVVWSVLGSALAGTLFTHLLGHFGSAWINERLPQLAASKHWHYLVSWVSSYGFVTLAAIAASPFAQTPALILAALLGLPWPEVFGALLLGKGLKYSLIGAVTARDRRNAGVCRTQPEQTRQLAVEATFIGIETALNTHQYHPFITSMEKSTCVNSLPCY